MTASSRASTAAKPSTVARPTSSRLAARLEYTDAPSMPMKTQTVTSIMFRTWVMVPPSGSEWICVERPQTSAVNRPALNPIAAIATNTRMGTILRP